MTPLMSGLVTTSWLAFVCVYMWRRVADLAPLPVRAWSGEPRNYVSPGKRASQP